MQISDKRIESITRSHGWGCEKVSFRTILPEDSKEDVKSGPDEHGQLQNLPVESGNNKLGSLLANIRRQVGLTLCSLTRLPVPTCLFCHC
jgi:hypothetical protein